MREYAQILRIDEWSGGSVDRPDSGYDPVVTSIGYFLSCEQYGPKELIDQAKRAEAAGFERLWISDHFHPWNDEPGQSAFVWGVIGAATLAAGASRCRPAPR